MFIKLAEIYRSKTSQLRIALQSKRYNFKEKKQPLIWINKNSVYRMLVRASILFGWDDAVGLVKKPHSIFARNL